MESRCRLCAEPSAAYSDALDNFKLYNRILQLYNVKIEAGDKLPTTVCIKCCEHVGKAWDFNEKVQNSQTILSQLLQLTASENKQEILDVILDNEDFQETKPLIVTISEEKYVSDDNFESSVHQPEDITEDEPDQQVNQITNRRSKRIENNVLGNFECNSDGTITLNLTKPGWESYEWICSLCAFKGTTADDLRCHSASMHSQLPKYTCVDCAQTFTNHDSFLTHVGTHRPHLLFSCNICFKWYSCMELVRKHRKQHTIHISCSVCGKTCRNSGSLNSHMLTHNAKTPEPHTVCHLCSKKFLTKINLNAHLRNHDAGNTVHSYNCQECENGFESKSAFIDHLVTHRKKQFLCAICGKSFNKEQSLNHHVTTQHTIATPYECVICDKKFTQKNSLEDHHRIHTNEKPFACTFCDKTYRLKLSFDRHVRQHALERRFSCTECEQYFKNYRNYTKHMKKIHKVFESAQTNNIEDESSE